MTMTGFGIKLTDFSFDCQHLSSGKRMCLRKDFEESVEMFY